MSTSNQVTGSAKAPGERWELLTLVESWSSSHDGNEAKNLS
ncbi:MAG: hypothetical protein QW128_06595 [Thermoprotei archaeon]